MATKKLWQLLVKCPKEQDTGVGCPLEFYRETMSYAEKYEFIEVLSPSMVEAILTVHDECFHEHRDRG